LPIPNVQAGFINGEEVIYQSLDQYKLTLRIFEAHNTASLMVPLLMEQIRLTQEETGMLYGELEKCIVTLTDVNHEREELHILRDKEIKNYKRDVRKEKIKAILIGASAGVVGIAGGIIIGFFAIR
jgi:hypothetical protein